MKSAKADLGFGNLSNATYASLATRLKELDSAKLVQLLAHPSTKVGDTAAGLLATREEVELVMKAILEDRIETSLGRQRALHIFNSFGCQYPKTIDAYVHCLSNRKLGVVENALFGIVFMRRRDLIPELQRHLESATGSRRKSFQKAIESLRADDPAMFAPGFWNKQSVWRLPPKQ